MPGKVVRVLVKTGDRGRRPSAGRRRRSDEDGERAARQPRRARSPRSTRAKGCRSTPARCSSSFSERSSSASAATGSSATSASASRCVVALLAAAIVTSVTIDLGPAVRARAENAGSKYIERPLHIGALKIRLLTGKVLVEDLAIDGLHAGDRPFFTARRIAVALDWVPAFSRQPDITISSVEMTDWQMLVEKWEGAHNFPRFSHDDGKPPRSEAVHDDAASTCARIAASSRSRITRRRGAWSARNLDINIGNLPKYHGTRDLHRRHGRDSGLRPDVGEHEGAVRHRRVAHSPRSHRHATPTARRRSRRGDVDMAHWPKQSYQVQVARELSAHARAVLQGRDRGGSPATATSPAPSICSRPATRPTAISTGTFTSELAGRQRLPLPGAVRIAALDAARLRRLERRLAVLWRRRAVRLRHQAVRREDASRRTVSTRR